MMTQELEMEYLQDLIDRALEYTSRPDFKDCSIPMHPEDRRIHAEYICLALRAKGFEAYYKKGAFESEGDRFRVFVEKKK